jgi:hypothetical protein
VAGALRVAVDDEAAPLAPVCDVLLERVDHIHVAELGVAAVVERGLAVERRVHVAHAREARGLAADRREHRRGIREVVAGRVLGSIDRRVPEDAVDRVVGAELVHERPERAVGQRLGRVGDVLEAVVLREAGLAHPHLVVGVDRAREAGIGVDGVGVTTVGAGGAAARVGVTCRACACTCRARAGSVAGAAAADAGAAGRTRAGARAAAACAAAARPRRRTVTCSRCAAAARTAAAAALHVVGLRAVLTVVVLAATCCPEQKQHRTHQD